LSGVSHAWQGLPRSSRDRGSRARLRAYRRAWAHRPAQRDAM